MHNQSRSCRNPFPYSVLPFFQCRLERIGRALTSPPPPDKIAGKMTRGAEPPEPPVHYTIVIGDGEMTLALPRSPVMVLYLVIRDGAIGDFWAVASARFYLHPPDGTLISIQSRHFHNLCLIMLQEKMRERQKDLHMVFVDLEKTYDTLPRDLIWFCPRKRGVVEEYVRVIQDTYCECETTVVTTVGETDGMTIDVGLHQESALSPFLFILVLDVITEDDLFLVLLTNAIGAVG